MSIEVIGPRKYKFQDSVCALLAILAVNDTGAELHVEPQDGEDALLILNVSGNAHAIEVQVKGEGTAISSERLVGWLAHFPARRADGSLLERLLSDANRTVLFVASGRCSDDTFHYAVPLSITTTSIQSGAIKRKTEQSIRAALQDYASKSLVSDKDLMKRRRSHIGRKLPLIQSTALTAALHRILIVERLDEVEVKRLCIEGLKSIHRVVPDLINQVLDQIEAIVLREKRSGRNILPDVLEAIAKSRSSNPLIAGPYVPRGDELLILERLARDRAVLLAGAPRIGKTLCARWLAAELQGKGFSARVCDGLADAQRFLMDPVRGLRVALVDDPLGGSHPAEDASREMQLLEQLIPMLTNERRLIVSQAQDRLLETSRRKSVEEIRTGRLRWVSLSIGDGAFLERVWLEVARTYDVPAYLRERVRDGLSCGELVLEPGCLLHLAVNHERLGHATTLEEIVRLARQDARSLGLALSKEGFAPLLAALAIATTPELPVSETEIAFVLGNGGPDRPGESNVIATGFTIGAKHKVPKRHDPGYDPAPHLEEPTENALEVLELRRILAVNLGKYTFTHPFYRASSEALIDAASKKAERMALSMLDRCLFSLSPVAANAAAKNLGWIYHTLDRESVFAMAKAGLRSIFPVVRDSCFAFLTKRLHSLPVDEQNEISMWVEKVTFFDVSHMEWVDDQPRIPAATFAGTLEVDPFSKSISRGDVEPILRALDSDSADAISPEVAARAAMFLKRKPEAMTIQMVGRLLSYDASLIRAPAAGAWLRRPRRQDYEVLDRIFSENHPAVTKEIYRAVIEVWGFCDPERRELLKKSIQEMAASPIVATALIEQLVVFGRREYMDETPPWEVFEAVMPVVLNELPLGVAVRDDRLYDVMDRAIGRISKSSLIDIIDRWIDLLEGIARSGVPTDYMLGVSDILVRGMNGDSPSRVPRIERLLSIPGTAARIRIVADLVDAWERLVKDERLFLLNHLRSHDVDVVWLQAAALTRRFIPTEIEIELFPFGLSLSQSPEVLIREMPKKLLNASVHVFTGNHPTIYYVGAQGSRSAVWKNIVVEIARRPDHAMFEEAWEWLMATGETDVLADLVMELGTEHANRVANLLFERKLRTSGEFMPQVWEALFSLELESSVRSAWIVRMASIAPKVLNSLSEAKSWIPKPYRNEFYSHFKEDVDLIKLLHTISKSVPNLSSDELASSLIAEPLIGLVRKFIEQMPPRHWSTFDTLRAQLKAIGIDDEDLFMSLADLRSRGLEAIDESQSYAAPEFPCWVGRI
jgi:hypothetical protein